MPVAKRGTRKLVVFDAVVLSNFALAERLDVITTRYRGRGAVTTEVSDEIDRGVASGYAALETVAGMVGGRGLRLLTLTREERRLYATLLRHLGAGEASCLAVVEARGGVVATDDRAARARCASMGILVTGTIGILKAACQDGNLSAEKADDSLRRMIAAGFYSPVRTISSIL